MIKSVLVREIVNSDVGENRELTSLCGGFRDCSTDNAIASTRIEAYVAFPATTKTDMQLFITLRLLQRYIYFSFTITSSEIQQDICTKTTLEEHAVYFFAPTEGRVSPFSINLLHLH